MKFKENFSIGLIYNPKGEKGTIVLLRCNGPHGGIKGIAHHSVCHLHLSTAERINSNLKPEGNIMLTQEYSTLETAIQFFIKRINLLSEDRQKFFPPPSGQIDLFSNN